MMNAVSAMHKHGEAAGTFDHMPHLFNAQSHLDKAAMYHSIGDNKTAASFLTSAAGMIKHAHRAIRATTGFRKYNDPVGDLASDANTSAELYRREAGLGG
jgi:hypothetical protein